jgi:hypothetical protein
MGFSNKLPPLTQKISQEQKQDISSAKKVLPLLQVQEDAADILPSAEKKPSKELTDIRNDFKYSSPFESPTQSPRTNQESKSGNQSDLEVHQVIHIKKYLYKGLRLKTGIQLKSDFYKILTVYQQKQTKR